MRARAGTGGAATTATNVCERLCMSPGVEKYVRVQHCAESRRKPAEAHTE